jgi:hypothetical protein
MVQPRSVVILGSFQRSSCRVAPDGKVPSSSAGRRFDPPLPLRAPSTLIAASVSASPAQHQTSESCSVVQTSLGRVTHTHCTELLAGRHRGTPGWTSTGQAGGAQSSNTGPEKRHRRLSRRGKFRPQLTAALLHRAVAVSVCVIVRSAATGSGGEWL